MITRLLKDGGTLPLPVPPERRRRRLRGDLDRNLSAQPARDKIDAEYPEAHWRRAFAASMLGETLLALGRDDDARPLLEASVDSIEKATGKDSVFARDARR